MFLKKVLILFLTAAFMVAAYFIHQYLKEKINPRQSFLHFILFVLAGLIIIFGMIFLLSFILFQYKNFFFKA
jgi:dolichyl-phosphate-mannose--protein O-mannosyl transferase